MSSYYLKLKEYSEQLEWTPSSPSSPVEFLLLEQFDRCLTASALNEIERNIREVRHVLFPKLIFIIRLFSWKNSLKYKKHDFGHYIINSVISMNV